MVGAFIPFIKKLKGRVSSLKVIDKHREALEPGRQASVDAARTRCRGPGAGERAVSYQVRRWLKAGFESLEPFTSRTSSVMAGPTTPLWPRPFFNRGIAILGGIRVLTAEHLLTIVGQGGRATCSSRPLRRPA